MEANQSSPGVVVQERDLTTITTLSTANVGVIAAPFELGPVEEVLEVETTPLHCVCHAFQIVPIAFASCFTIVS